MNNRWPVKITWTDEHTEGSWWYETTLSVLPRRNDTLNLEEAPDLPEGASDVYALVVSQVMFRLRKGNGDGPDVQVEIECMPRCKRCGQLCE